MPARAARAGRAYLTCRRPRRPRTDPCSRSGRTTRAARDRPSGSRPRRAAVESEPATVDGVAAASQRGRRRASARRADGAPASPAQASSPVPRRRRPRDGLRLGGRRAAALERIIVCTAYAIASARKTARARSRSSSALPPCPSPRRQVFVSWPWSLPSCRLGSGATSADGAGSLWFGGVGACRTVLGAAAGVRALLPAHRP